MKQKWERPRTLVQQFEANEYVAACTKEVSLTCDAGYDVTYRVNGSYTEGFYHCYKTIKIEDPYYLETVTLVSDTPETQTTGVNAVHTADGYHCGSLSYNAS